MGTARFIKCVTVGDVVVGKTCMPISYTSNTFSTDCVPTVFDNFCANVVVDGSIVNLGLWDTAGQEGLQQAYAFELQGCRCVLAGLFSHQQSQWIPELRLYAPTVPIILIGTKLELRDDKQYLIDLPGATPIRTSQGEELKKMIGAAVFLVQLQDSAGNLNVKSVFDAAIKVVLQPPKPRKKRRKTRSCVFL